MLLHRQVDLHELALETTPRGGQLETRRSRENPGQKNPQLSRKINDLMDLMILMIDG